MKPQPPSLAEDTWVAVEAVKELKSSYHNGLKSSYHNGYIWQIIRFPK